MMYNVIPSIRNISNGSNTLMEIFVSDNNNDTSTRYWSKRAVLTIRYLATEVCALRCLLINLLNENQPVRKHDYHLLPSHRAVCILFATMVYRYWQWISERVVQCVFGSFLSCNCDRLITLFMLKERKTKSIPLISWRTRFAVYCLFPLRVGDRRWYDTAQAKRGVESLLGLQRRGLTTNMHSSVTNVHSRYLGHNTPDLIPFTGPARSNVKSMMITGQPEPFTPKTDPIRKRASSHAISGIVWKKSVFPLIEYDICPICFFLCLWISTHVRFVASYSSYAYIGLHTRIRTSS